MSGYWERITRERIARRRLLKSGASISIGGAALALVGCGGDDDDSASPTKAPGATSASGTPAGKPGGTLEYGFNTDLTDLEPHVAIRDHGDTINIVWETISKYDKDLNPIGVLSESWEINDDATEFVFHVRPGVKWHPYNGSSRDVTAQDIVYNLDRVKNPESGGFAQLKAFADLYSGWEAPDDKTFILKSTIPRPTTFDGLLDMRIGFPEWLDDKAAGKAASSAIGTGPFYLEEWRQGDQFNLKKFPDYWEPGKPLLDEIVFHVSLDPQTAITQFEAGALHVVKDSPVRDFVRWRDGGKFQAVTQDNTGSFYCMGYNTTYEPFYDKRVRQAMNWLIDRQRFADAILLKTAQPYSLPWPPASIAYEEEKSNFYSFDQDKAKALLAEAGMDKGFSGEMVLTPTPLEEVEFSQVYQEDLAKVDIKFEINVMEVAAFVELINADPPGQKGMWFSLSGRANLGAPITMVNFANVLFGNQLNGTLPNGQQFGDNNTGYYSEEWKNVVDAINAESNVEKLKPLYSKMNDIFIEDSFIAFIGPIPGRVGLAPNVRGVRAKTAGGGFLYDEAYFES